MHYSCLIIQGGRAYLRIPKSKGFESALRNMHASRDRDIVLEGQFYADLRRRPFDA